MNQLASRINRLHPSPIRDILHVIDQPGMISFAGGLPSPNSFPVMQANIDSQYLQYGPSEGDPELRQHVAAELNNRGIPADPEHVLILSGSQQGIDLVAKLAVEQGTRVAVESPTYLAALQVFSLFGADYIPFSPDNPEALIEQEQPALTYVIPTFQNPTGHVYTSSQRQRLADVCDKTNTIVFEDDPYRALIYDDCDRTPVVSYVKKSSWIYQSSFSKTLAPGLRLGYLTCSPELFPYLVRLKQAADLHSNRVAQRMVLTELTQSDRARQLAQVVDNYRLKRDQFEHLLNSLFQEIADWETPKGGLFFWLKLKGKQTIDTRKLLPLAIDKKVAFMPGEPFYPDNRAAAGELRLNFSHASESQIEQGLTVLRDLIQNNKTI